MKYRLRAELVEKPNGVILVLDSPPIVLQNLSLEYKAFLTALRAGMEVSGLEAFRQEDSDHQTLISLLQGRALISLEDGH